jgi:hypothetical protein
MNRPNIWSDNLRQFRSVEHICDPQRNSKIYFEETQEEYRMQQPHLKNSGKIIRWMQQKNGSKKSGYHRYKEGVCSL